MFCLFLLTISLYNFIKIHVCFDFVMLNFRIQILFIIIDDLFTFAIILQKQWAYFGIQCISFVTIK